MPAKERNIGVCILLSIVTCGIYQIYWMIMLNDEMLDASREEGTSGGIVFLLSLVTCGIYGIYWDYVMGKKVDQLTASYGRYTDNSGLLYLVLGLFGLQIVVHALIQSELNSYYRHTPATYV